MALVPWPFLTVPFQWQKLNSGQRCPRKWTPPIHLPSPTKAYCFSWKDRSQPAASHCKSSLPGKGMTKRFFLPNHKAEEQRMVYPESALAKAERLMYDRGPMLGKGYLWKPELKYRCRILDKWNWCVKLRENQGKRQLRRALLGSKLFEVLKDKDKRNLESRNRNALIICIQEPWWN